jgi:hypothetical protein
MPPPISGRRYLKFFLSLKPDRRQVLRHARVRAGFRAPDIGTHRFGGKMFHIISENTGCGDGRGNLVGIYVEKGHRDNVLPTFC